MTNSAKQQASQPRPTHGKWPHPPQTTSPRVHSENRHERLLLRLAGNDAFRDENYKFALKLIKAGVKVEIKELKLLPHGFLNFNLPIFGMEESNKAIELGGHCLRQLLSI